MSTTQHRKPKFSIQKMTMDFSSKIRHIVGSVVCEKHQASVEEPCWWITSDGLALRAAVCGSRVSKMYNGPSASSKPARNYPKKENNR